MMPRRRRELTALRRSGCVPKSASPGRTNRLISVLVVISALQFVGMAVGAALMVHWAQVESDKFSAKADSFSEGLADNISRVQPVLLKANAILDRLNATDLDGLLNSLSRAEAVIAGLNLSNLDQGIAALENVTKGLEALNMSQLQDTVGALKDVTDSLQSLSRAIHGNVAIPAIRT